MSSTLWKKNILKRKFSNPIFTVALPDIIRRICELSHVWGKKSAIQTYQNSLQPPSTLPVPIYNQTPVPSGTLKLSEKENEEKTTFLQQNIDPTSVDSNEKFFFKLESNTFSFKGVWQIAKVLESIYFIFPARKTILIDDKSVRGYWHLALTTLERWRWHASFVIFAIFFRKSVPMYLLSESFKHFSFLSILLTSLADINYIFWYFMVIKYLFTNYYLFRKMIFQREKVTREPLRDYESYLAADCSWNDDEIRRGRKSDRQIDK